MKLVFIYRNIIIGGCEILIQRLSQELNKQCEVIVVCSSIDDSMRANFEAGNIHYIIEAEWCLPKIVKKYFTKHTSYITFFVGDFLEVWSVEKKYKNTFLYVVNPNIFNVARNKLKRFLILRFLRSFFIDLIDTHKIFFMDEQCLESTSKYLKTSVDKFKNALIIRISCDKNDNLLRDKIRPNSINILSIARADFPFKGYLLGLIEWFVNNCANDSRFNMKIITYGAGEKEIKDVYSNIDKKIQQKIEIIGKTNPSMIKDYIDWAAFYIGMGTTIINASQRGVISFPVATFTYDLIIKDYFYNVPNCVAIEKSDNEDFLDLKNCLIDIYDNRYQELSKKHVQVVSELYSSESNATHLYNLAKDLKEDKTRFGVKLYLKIKKLGKRSIMTS